MAGHSWWRAFRWPLFLSVLWCVLMLFLYQQGKAANAALSEERARIQARTLYAHILDTRAWNAAHGGVYVRESELGQPNKWIPEAQRTLLSADGTRLVLVNPAYMSRQISERSSLPGASYRITSHDPLRPENAADQWESKALADCISGAPEAFARIEEGQGIRYRYLKALRTQAACLGCHPENRVGDVRGGISVSLDASTFVRDVSAQNRSILLAYSLMCIAGCISIGGVSYVVHRRHTMQQERERMKNAFMANMSHDMRTPLTGILGMTELLSNSATKKEDVEALQYLQLAGSSLLEIVSDITDYAALDSGHLELVGENFDLRASVARCIELFTPQCSAKGLYLKATVADDVPALVCGDEFRLRQALGNLLSNSVKFTSEGGVHVSVSRLGTMQVSQKQKALSMLGTRLVLRFEVADTGTGICAEDQQRIFERFERGSAAQRSGQTGTGLGLSIAQDIARRMGGSITVSSEPDKGASFIFTAQFGAVDAAHAVEPDGAADPTGPGEPEEPGGKVWREVAAPVGTEPSPSCTEGTRGSILLAEDNTVTAHFMEAVLQKAGYTVCIAPDGQCALDMLQESPADLVLLDMRMPGVDGLTVLRALRKSKGLLSRIPVVVMSASVLQEEKKILATLGVQGVLLKPLGTEALLRAVGEHLSPVEPTQKDRAGHEKASRPDFDLASALETMEGNEELLRSLCALWLEESSERMSLMRAALAKKDAGTVQSLAHALKNSAGTLHLKRLHHWATQVEEGVEGTAGIEPVAALLEAEKDARAAVREWLEGKREG